jgi:hypothetical protein
MARTRQGGSQNWARSAFAVFWILLACLSGFYLFTVLTDPTLGGQIVKLSPVTPGDTTSAVGGGDGSRSEAQELAAIQETLRALSQQVAELSDRLEGRETSDAPAPPEPSASAATSSPPPEPAAEAEDTAAPTSPPEEAPEEPKSAQAEAPKPAEPPEPEAKPVEQAALAANQAPSSSPEPETPPQPSEPPPVAVSPLDELPAELAARNMNQPDAAPPATGEPASDEQGASPAPAASQAAESPADSPAPSEQPGTSTQPEPEAASTSPEPSASPSSTSDTEVAALDPIALPPAANDGSTRYGIEIGTVAKQDGLRPLWREFLTKHAALVAGLQPRRVLAPDKKWRLIAGPFTSAAEASQACALFKKAARPCEATVYAGDSL